MITHEEARNKVKSNHNKFYTEGEFTKDMLDYISQQEKQQAEHEALKRDVARYFELFELQSNEAAFPTEYLFTDDDWRELYFLEEKLLKVGKEE